MNTKRPVCGSKDICGDHPPMSPTSMRATSMRVFANDGSGDRSTTRLMGSRGMIWFVNAMYQAPSGPSATVV